MHRACYCNACSIHPISLKYPRAVLFQKWINYAFPWDSWDSFPNELTTLFPWDLAASIPHLHVLHLPLLRVRLDWSFQPISKLKYLTFQFHVSCLCMKEFTFFFLNLTISCTVFFISSFVLLILIFFYYQHRQREVKNNNRVLKNI